MFQEGKDVRLLPNDCPSLSRYSGKGAKGKKTNSTLTPSPISNWQVALAFQLLFKAHSSEKCELSKQRGPHSRPRL